MIYQVVALLGFVLLQGSFGYVAVSPSPTPSPWFECPMDEGLYPSPRNCSEFFVCTNGLPWEQFCAGGLYFNPATRQCDWPANVDCRVTEAPSVKENLQPKFHSLQKLPGYQGTDLGVDVNYTCPEDFGVFPHHECRKYYDCQNGKAHLILCWYDYYFDLTYNGCNYPNMVDCTGRDLPDDVSTTSAAPPTKTTPFPFNCPTADGFFPVPGECSDRYIICVDNIAYLEHCPANSIFNPANNLCEDPANVDCVPDTTLAPETTTAAITSVTEPKSTTQSSHFTCPSADGLYPSPTNCGDYYVCQAGTAILNHCPQGLYFNTLTEICDWPENVDCNVKSVKAKRFARIPARVQAKAQSTDLGIDANYTCPAAWGVFPHPQCREYYDCRAGDAHVMLCPDDLLFDLTYNGCNYPVYTDCGDRVKPGDETTTQKVTVAPGFECPETNGFYASGTCSSRYYVCVNGNATPEVCPESTIFDDASHRCDNWDSVGGCLTSGAPNSTSTTTTTTKPSTTQSSGFSCPSSGGMFADPNNCNGYYVCEAGFATAMECAPGLYFNPAGYCDWPSNVPCSEKLHARMVKLVKVKKQRVQEDPSTIEIEPTQAPVTEELTSEAGTPTGTTNITPAWWFECPGSGNYPDPEDCAAYFTCVNGLAWLEKCPRGTAYDPESGTCVVSPDNKCVPTTNYPHTSPTKAPNVTADPSYECPAANGMFPNPLNCGTFYWCVDGAIYFMHCPASTEFNAAKQQCVDPSESNCVITEMRVPTQATVFQNKKVNRVQEDLSSSEIEPTQAPVTEELTSEAGTPTGTTNITPAWWFECPGSGTYPDPEDCAAYFTCINGLAWLEKCPKGTAYDPESGTCVVSPDNKCVPTTNYPHTSPTKAPNVTADPSYECPAANGMFSNPLDCGTFYWCVDGAIYFMHCPASTEFNAEKQQCVDPSESNCVITEMQVPTQATVFQNKKVNRPIIVQRQMHVNRKRLQQRGVA